MKKLRRARGGCPWDLKQTPASLKEYILEEAHELIEAIDGGAADAVKEELGDLLLQIVFLAQIAAEERKFTIVDVIDGIAAKLVRRHPHIFGSVHVRDADEVKAILAKVIITDIIENTYYAELHIEKDGRKKVIDCRPSDAVALALKNHAKIYVSRQVLETSVLADMFSNFLGGEDRIDTWFDSLSPDDFGGIVQ